MSLLNSMKGLSLILLCYLLLNCTSKSSEPEIKIPDYTLEFNDLPSRWDEAIPLGNGMLGALIWQKEGKLRFSLDRADLWDLRPTGFLNTDEFTYDWIYKQWKDDNYKAVQEKFDNPYDQLSAPTKIPAGALEFDITKFGEITSVKLLLKNALCEIQWQNGTKLSVFIDAEKPEGWYRFENIGNNAIESELIAPAYTKKASSDDDESVVITQDLKSLGYPEGILEKKKNQITYTQKGWGDFEYQISAITKENKKNVLEGVWSVSAHYPKKEKQVYAKELIDNSINTTSFQKRFKNHSNWWKNYWSASSITIPDTLLEKQWYLEHYKFGAAARKNAPPISLQAVWTADNGLIPPWKGDFHHDLNTQLSYWPAYSGNHLDLEEGFIYWLWDNKDEFYKYTQKFYNVKGLNVPGVTTLTGQPMGGWVQYSCGPTVSAWLAHHFYLHWRYTMDRTFLKEKAYPWIKEVAIFLDEISIKDKNGLKKLPISSSPEIYNNTKAAWFENTTNYDLAFIRWTYEKATELAKELELTEESEEWQRILSKWPDFDIDEETGLTFAPNHPYQESHRHFSHQVGYHPLGVIDISRGESHKQAIQNTLSNLDEKGSDWWVGYSFSWLAGLKARAFDGEGASDALKVFTTAFCSPNSFHLNGDQSGKGYSFFTYRPFTLEGNFAFASSLQEMLIQSHTGIIRVFPAIPENWKYASFQTLRTEGAFLVSANMQDGLVKEIKITAEESGTLKLFNPFKNESFESTVDYQLEKGIIIINIEKGETVILNKKI